MKNYSLIRTLSCLPSPFPFPSFPPKRGIKANSIIIISNNNSNKNTTDSLRLCRPAVELFSCQCICVCSWFPRPSPSSTLYIAGPTALDTGGLYIFSRQFSVHGHGPALDRPALITFSHQSSQFVYHLFTIVLSSFWTVFGCGVGSLLCACVYKGLCCVSR